MKRILVIEDDEKIRTVFARYLGGQGYMVECAANGKEGLQLLEAEPPDLVVTDILMPEVDGLEVTLSMRKLHPDIPVIAISGGMHASPVDPLSIVKKLGATKVFYKPVVLAELLASIMELLAESGDTCVSQ